MRSKLFLLSAVFAALAFGGVSARADVLGGPGFYAPSER